MRSRLVIASVIATLAVLALGAATHLEPIPFGLHAEITAGRERLTGDVFPLREGDYLFSTGDRGPAAILVDAQPVSGSIHLIAGAHAVLIERDHADGEPPLRLRWARNGATPEDVPGWALRPRKVHSLGRLRLDVPLAGTLATGD